MSEIRQRIEEQLEKAGLGRKYDKEIPVLATAIYRDEIRQERESKQA